MIMEKLARTNNPILTHSHRWVVKGSGTSSHREDGTIWPEQVSWVGGVGEGTKILAINYPIPKKVLLNPTSLNTNVLISVQTARRAVKWGWIPFRGGRLWTSGCYCSAKFPLHYSISAKLQPVNFLGPFLKDDSASYFFKLNSEVEPLLCLALASFGCRRSRPHA